jgi:hypothetical protein
MTLMDLCVLAEHFELDQHRLPNLHVYASM